MSCALAREGLTGSIGRLISIRSRSWVLDPGSRAGELAGRLGMYCICTWGFCQKVVRQRVREVTKLSPPAA